MMQKIWSRREKHLLLWFIVLWMMYFFIGCSEETDHTSKDNNSPTALAESSQAVSYSPVTVEAGDDAEERFLYNPVDNVLCKISCHKNTYRLSAWRQKSDWTTEVGSWKTKKNYTLDNFRYNTNGALYACQKRRKKGKLTEQSLVRLGSNGSIHKIKLTDLNHISGTSSKSLPEIADLQCNGTSLAVTYQYGAVKIYNLAEGQALGAATLTGTPGQNIYYDFHYLTIVNSEKKQNILLRDYDIRSGETIHTFPLGGPGEKHSSFHLSHYQNDLYVQTSHGIFAGQCTDTTLAKVLDYEDLDLPKDSQITYLQAARDHTLYLGYRDEKDQFCLRLLLLPDSQAASTPQQSDSKTHAKT